MVLTDAAANRALRGGLLAGDVALVVVAPRAGLLSPTIILPYPSVWVLTAFSLILFLAVARRLTVADRIVAGLIVPMAQFALPSFLDLTIHLAPQTRDATAVALDGEAGWWVRSMVASWFAASLALRRVCDSVYGLLPLVVSAAAAFEFSAGGTRAAEARTLQGFVLTGCLGFGLYMLMPVVGPVYYGGNSWMLGPPTPAGVAAAVPRNGMPSLHTAWTLLAFLATQGRGRPVRAVFAAAMMLTILATLGFGLHYLCDLVAALPLVLVVRAACHKTVAFGGRMAGMGMGGLLLAAWVVVVTGSGPAPGWAPGLLIGSMGLPLAWETWRSRSSEGRCGIVMG